MTPELMADFDRFSHRALMIGAAGLAACALGWFLNPDQFYRSWLIGFMFWNGVTLGCLAIGLLHQLSGGAWGVVIRRILESAMRMFPVTLALFLPLLFGIRSLYVWSNPATVAADKALQHKAAYLNVPFFMGRAALYFAVWMAIAYFFNKWSLEQDRRGAEPWASRLELLGGPGLLLYGATVTFSSIDWVMSLDPHWYSTIFGILFIGGQGVSALAFVIATLVLVAARPPMADVITDKHLRDVGTLLFAFIMLWAYFSFSQFLLIWSGNLPAEIPFYLKRTQGWRMWAGLCVVVCHFALPFLLLLSRDFKSNRRLMARMAVWVMVMRVVDLLWVTGFELHWLDVAAPVALGGVWLAAFFRQLKQRPLLPLHDPELEEALEHGRE
ncbi:MAG TPA: hypothetical protein VL285_22065 [Bryobacteraceae bacterium]|nr:hypothetical protein [Bryobacteraceae bacterium]